MTRFLNYHQALLIFLTIWSVGRKRRLDKLHGLVGDVTIKTFDDKQRLVLLDHHKSLIHAFRYHGNIRPLMLRRMELKIALELGQKLLLQQQLYMQELQFLLIF